LSGNQYLRKLLYNQEIDIEIINNFKKLWKKINTQIKAQLDEKYYMYYGGSFRKDTMIKESYDLDIVLTIRHDSNMTTKDFFYFIGDILDQNQWKKLYKNRVSWRIYLQNDFHIDVVPGKYTGKVLHESYLFNSEAGKTLKTNIEIHENFVKENDCQDIIRLLKIWRHRRNIFAKTFILEQLAILSYKHDPSNNLHHQFITCLEYIEKKIMFIELKDPANPKNIITDTLSYPQREYLKNEARLALEKKYIEDVFSPKD